MITNKLSLSPGWKMQPLNFHVCISPHLWPPDGWMGDIIRSAASWEQQETIICHSSGAFLHCTFLHGALLHSTCLCSAFLQCALFASCRHFSPLYLYCTSQLPPVFHFSPPFLFLTPSVPSHLLAQSAPRIRSLNLWLVLSFVNFHFSLVTFTFNFKLAFQLLLLYPFPLLQPHSSS